MAHGEASDRGAGSQREEVAAREATFWSDGDYATRISTILLKMCFCLYIYMHIYIYIWLYTFIYVYVQTVVEYVSI